MNDDSMEKIASDVIQAARIYLGQVKDFPSLSQRQTENTEHFEAYIRLAEARMEYVKEVQK